MQRSCIFFVQVICCCCNVGRSLQAIFQPLNLHGSKMLLKGVDRAAQEARGLVKKNDGNDRLNRVTSNNQIALYSCTRYGLLETALK